MESPDEFTMPPGHRAPKDQPLELVDVAGDASAWRVVPVLVAVLLVLAIVRRRRR